MLSSEEFVSLLEVSRGDARRDIPQLHWERRVALGYALSNRQKHSYLCGGLNLEGPHLRDPSQLMNKNAAPVRVSLQLSTPYLAGLVHVSFRGWNGYAACTG
jgi:hypothetical protein